MLKLFSLNIFVKRFLFMKKINVGNYSSNVAAQQRLQKVLQTYKSNDTIFQVLHWCPGSCFENPLKYFSL